MTIKSIAKFEEMAEIANFDKGGSTVVGNPLHHFGGDAYKVKEHSNSTQLNKNILAEIPETLDDALDKDLLF